MQSNIDIIRGNSDVECTKQSNVDITVENIKYVIILHKT